MVNFYGSPEEFEEENSDGVDCPLQVHGSRGGSIAVTECRNYLYTFQKYFYYENDYFDYFYEFQEI